MRFARIVLALIGVLTFFFNPVASADDADGTPVFIGDGAIPKGRAGQTMNVTIPLVNGTGEVITDLVVIPNPNADIRRYPFETTTTPNATVIDKVNAGDQVNVDLGNFTVLGNLGTGNYGFPFVIQYRINGFIQRAIYKEIFITIEGVPQPAPEAPKPIIIEAPQYIEVPINVSSYSEQQTYAPGDVEMPTGNNNAPAPTSGTPRVMLVGFNTNPVEVTAGKEFDLNFTLQNMSSDMQARNIKATLTSADASLLPVSGAASVYIDSLGAGATSGNTLRFQALPGLEERPYLLTMQIDYEANGAPVTAQETLAVVVRQEARVDIGSVTISPNVLEVGRDASVTFSIRNRGKSVIYNAQVKVKDDQGVSAQENFIGNIPAGTAASADLLIHGDRTTDKPVMLEISYEDASGRATTIEREIELAVIEAQQEDPMEGMQVEGAGFSLFSLVPYLVILMIIGGIIALVLTLRKRRQKRTEMAEQMNALDDGPFLGDGGMN